MAITFDSQANSTYSSGGTCTWTHTCSGTDRIIFVAGYFGNSAAATAKYDGVTMTEINNRLMTGPASGQYIRMWYLVNPAVGTKNCVLTSTADMYGLSSSYKGAIQTSPIDVSNTNGNTLATGVTTSVTTTTDNDWLVGFVYAGTAISAGANTVLRSGISTVLYIIDSNSSQTPVGSKSMTITHSSSFNGMLMSSFKPAITTTQNSQFLQFFD